MPDPEETEREAAEVAALVEVIRDDYDRFSGPGEAWSVEGLAISIVDAGFRRLSESEIRREITVRPNPTMPSAEKLAELYDEAVIDAWGGDVIALANSTLEDQQAVGFRAIWRHGCDTGMVAE